jgi:uncharacterized protein (TIGR02611 family)
VARHAGKRPSLEGVTGRRPKSPRRGPSVTLTAQSPTTSGSAGATCGCRPDPESVGFGGKPDEAGGDLSGTEDGKRLGFRARIEEKPTLRRTYQVGVAVLGGLVLAAGVIMIPYPGPGWLVVFAGLAILATEFIWARRVLTFARGKYDAWTDWLGRQTLVVRLAVLTLTGLVVLATLYLLNAFYLVASVVGLEHWTWLQSPFFA